MHMFELRTIAHIHNGFREKFGIPRQSGLSDIESRIVFEKDYRDANAVRGLEGFSHIWLLWGFSANEQDQTFRPTVRPPRLGGNERMGVFATRSPFRPNPIGLSCVRLKETIITDDGPVLTVIGADLMDGTPIYDIKPYLSQFDSHPEASCGFVDQRDYGTLEVEFPKELRDLIPADDLPPLMQALQQDPRPHYQEDPQRIYGMAFGSFNVRFKVKSGVLTVVGLDRL